MVSSKPSAVESAAASAPAAISPDITYGSPAISGAASTTMSGCIWMLGPAHDAVAVHIGDADQVRLDLAPLHDPLRQIGELMADKPGQASRT